MIIVSIYIISLHKSIINCIEVHYWIFGKFGDFFFFVSQDSKQAYSSRVGKRLALPMKRTCNRTSIIKKKIDVVWQKWINVDPVSNSKFVTEYSVYGVFRLNKKINIVCYTYPLKLKNIFWVITYDVNKVFFFIL